MALYVIVDPGTGEHRWRAEIDPHNGWTRLWDGVRVLATAWCCDHDHWEAVRPDTPLIRRALNRVSETLERLGFAPSEPHELCDDDRCANPAS